MRMMVCSSCGHRGSMHVRSCGMDSKVHPLPALCTPQQTSTLLQAKQQLAAPAPTLASSLRASSLSLASSAALSSASRAPPAATAPSTCLQGPCTRHVVRAGRRGHVCTATVLMTAL